MRLDSPGVQAGHREASHGWGNSSTGCVAGLSPLTPGSISYDAKRLVSGAICLLLQHIVGLVHLSDQAKLLLHQEGRALNDVCLG